MASASNFRPSETLVLIKAGAESITVTAEVIGTGDGSTSAFSGTLAGAGVVDPRSIKISAPSAAGPPVVYETFTLNHAGALVGSDGGTGVLNIDTGVFSLTTDANVPDTLDITINYTHLDVRGEDIVLAEDVEFKVTSEPLDQNPAVGALSGALPAAGEPVAEVSMTVPVYPAPGFAAVSNLRVKEVASGATSIAFTLPPGVLNVDLYPTAPAGLSATALTLVLKAASDDSTVETYTVNNMGVATGDDTGSGTVDWETGKVSLTLDEITGAHYILINGLQHKPSSVHPFMTMSHAYTQSETADLHCHHYHLDRCNQVEAGIRVITKSTDCTTGIEYRGDRMRMVPTIKGEVNERILIELEGFASVTRGPCDLASVPSPGLIAEDNPITHARADVTLKAKATSGDVTFAGRLIGGFEQRSPFSTEQLNTASGNSVLAESLLVAANDSKTEFDLKFVFERPKDFDTHAYYLDNTLVEITLEWASRVFPARTVKYEAVAYMSEVEMEDDQDTLFVSATFKLVYGLPGQSNLGRDPSQPLGRWSFCTVKNP